MPNKKGKKGILNNHSSTIRVSPESGRKIEEII